VVDARKPDVGGDVSEADAGEDVGVLVIESPAGPQTELEEQESAPRLISAFQWFMSEL
jgi:hypothetical protein